MLEIVYFIMTNKEIDYKLAAEQLRTGKPLFGKKCALAPLLERISNAALDGKMDAHRREGSRESVNRRNGKMPETPATAARRTMYSCFRITLHTM